MESDKAFFEALEKVDWSKLLASAQVLASLTQSDYLKSLQTVLAAMSPIAKKVEGVTGDVLFMTETRHGLILIGGKGPNTYDVKGPVALLIDLGGDDVYKGTSRPATTAGIPTASSSTWEATTGMSAARWAWPPAVSVSACFTMWPATTLTSSVPARGGVGLGGSACRWTAKATTNTKAHASRKAPRSRHRPALGRCGQRQHTSWGLALGFGGPGGLGIVLDNAGNDQYQCGYKYPSGYNKSDAPTAKPGDPEFQWDSFGLAMGMGRRVCPPDPDALGFNLAGGIGMVIDLAGNDKYDSSNFSQACGYFFGIGLMLDLAGDDHYQAARYGLSSGAHYGLGLFIDYQGKDTYNCVGPTYNCAAAWDRRRLPVHRRRH